eukprot:gene10211-21289_t
MTAFIQILCVETYDSSSCVVFDTDNRRLIFNVGEGTQRLCIEHKVRLGKISNICLTELSPETVSGLPGMCLTAADAGKTEVSLTGPINTSKFWSSTRHFMNRSNFTMNIQEIQNSNIINKFEDMILHCIPISNSPLSNINNNSICYICELPTQLGKFDINKAKALKIPKGPLYGLLKTGNNITLEDGRVITPEDVLGPSVPARYIAIICNISPNNEELLHSLISNDYWKRFQKSQDATPIPTPVSTSTTPSTTTPSNSDIPHHLAFDCMVHLSPVHTVQQPLYRSWMESFGTRDVNIDVNREGDGEGDDVVTHLMAGRGMCDPQSAYIAATKYCHKLRKVSEELFPHLSISGNINTNNTFNNDSIGIVIQSDSSSSHIRSDGIVSTLPSTPLSLRLVSAVPLMKYHLMPSRLRGLTTNKYTNTDRDKDTTLNTVTQQQQQSKQSVVVERHHTTIEQNVDEDVIGNGNSNTNVVLVIENSSHTADVDVDVDVDVNKPSMTLDMDVDNEIKNETDAFWTEALTSSQIAQSIQKMSIIKSELLQTLHNNNFNKLQINENRNNNSQNIENRISASNVLHLEHGSILLDAGEGSWQQLLRIAHHAPHIGAGGGSSSIHNSSSSSTSNATVMRDLDNNDDKNVDDDDVVARRAAEALHIVWISHPHADHHLGLIRIISERRKLLLQRNQHQLQHHVLSSESAPESNTNDSNNDYDNKMMITSRDNSNETHDHNITHTQHVTSTSTTTTSSPSPSLSFLPLLVIAPPAAYGVRIDDATTGWSLVYS